MHFAQENIDPDLGPVLEDFK